MMKYTCTGLARPPAGPTRITHICPVSLVASCKLYNVFCRANTASAHYNINHVNQAYTYYYGEYYLTIIIVYVDCGGTSGSNTILVSTQRHNE